MAPNDPPSEKLVHSQLNSGLQAEAIHYIAALYGPKHPYPENYGFDVLTGPKTIILNNSQPHIIYVTRAIMFIEPYYANWKVVRSGSEEWCTPERSLEEFVKELRWEFGFMTAQIEGGHAQDAIDNGA